MTNWYTGLLQRRLIINLFNWHISDIFIKNNTKPYEKISIPFGSDLRYKYNH
jgi:hypothetical protein